jgi:hypothetical protein
MKEYCVLRIAYRGVGVGVPLLGGWRDRNGGKNPPLPPLAKGGKIREESPLPPLAKGGKRREESPLAPLAKGGKRRGIQ